MEGGRWEGSARGAVCGGVVEALTRTEEEEDCVRSCQDGDRRIETVRGGRGGLGL